MRRAYPVALLVWATACPGDTEPTDLSGIARRDGVALAGVEVVVDGVTVTTDDQGRFTVDHDGSSPARVSVVDGDEAAVVFTCGGEVALDLPPPLAQGEATVEVRLESVPSVDTLTPIWLSASPEAGPTATGRQVDVAWTPIDQTGSVATFEGTVAPASRWVLVVLGHADGELVSSVVVSGEELVEGAVEQVWVVMSDETHHAWPWDGRLPEGADAVRIVQQIDVDGLLIDVPTFEADPPSARDVPVLDLDNREIDLAVSAVWNPSTTCAERDTGRWHRGLFPLVEEIVGYEADDVETPAPIVGRLDRDPLRVSWSQVPRGTALLEVAFSDGVHRLSASGPVDCADEDQVTWPESWPVPDRVDVEAEVRAGDGTVFARCAIDPLGGS